VQRMWSRLIPNLFGSTWIRNRPKTVLHQRYIRQSTNGLFSHLKRAQDFCYMDITTIYCPCISLSVVLGVFPSHPSLMMTPCHLFCTYTQSVSEWVALVKLLNSLGTSSVWPIRVPISSEYFSIKSSYT